MIYQLSNGKCIEISVEYFLEMTKDDEQDLIAMDVGFNVSETFNANIFKKSIHDEIDNNSNDDSFKALQDIKDSEKLNDSDFFPLDKNDND